MYPLDGSLSVTGWYVEGGHSGGGGSLSLEVGALLSSIGSHQMDAMIIRPDRIGSNSSGICFSILGPKLIAYCEVESGKNCAHLA